MPAQPPKTMTVWDRFISLIVTLLPSFQWQRLSSTVLPFKRSERHPLCHRIWERCYLVLRSLTLGLVYWCNLSIFGCFSRSHNTAALAIRLSLHAPRLCIWQAFFLRGSFLGVTTLSIDRFLAVYLHLRYQEFVTNNRVVSVVISNWVLSAIVSTIVAVRIPQRIPYMILGALGIFCLLSIAFLYFKIYLCVRHHQKQIRCLQVQQEAANVANVKKSATGSFYVYLVFSLCYLPQFSSFVIIAVMGFNTAVKTFSISAITFVFLNSSLNPFVYCWKMRHIRHAIMDTLENLCQHNCHIQSRGENV